MQVVQVESSSVEVIEVEVTTAADPTAGAVTFSFTAHTATDPGTFSSGSWDGSFDATTGQVTALSPTVGSSSATVDLTSASKWKMWIKFIVGSETVVKPVATVKVG